MAITRRWAALPHVHRRLAVHLSKTMCNLAHDIRQRSHNACADPETSSRRPLKSSRSHQEAEHKANCDNRQCDDDEARDKRGEHVSSNIYQGDTERAEEAFFKVLFNLWVLSVSTVNIFSSLIECRWNGRIQPGTETKLDLIFRYP